jgi:hypothetical protein
LFPLLIDSSGRRIRMDVVKRIERAGKKEGRQGKARGVIQTITDP